MGLHLAKDELINGGHPVEGGSLSTALEVLERFGQSLRLCDQARAQIRLILESLEASLGADALFWDPGNTSDPVECAGRVVLPPEWCRTFTARLLAEEGTNPPHILRTRMPPQSGQLGVPGVRSAALVRISRSHGSWLGAVSFGRRAFGASDLQVMLLARRMLLNHRQQTQAYENLRSSLFGLVYCLTAAIDAKDAYTGGHSERVARIAVRLGQQMSLSQSAIGDLYLAGLLHDIGKIGIRDSVLQKPGRLTPEEIAHIQEHPIIGDRLVGAVGPLAHLRPGVRNHHERFDGQGYPDGLAGDAIPLMARILAVADACDAMMSARPYRSALAPARIDAIMAEGAGTQWDPEVVAYFLACRHDLYPICQRGLGNSVVAAVDRVLERMRPVGESTQTNPGSGSGW